MPRPSLHKRWRQKRRSEKLVIVLSPFIPPIKFGLLYRADEIFRASESIPAVAYHHLFGVNVQMWTIVGGILLAIFALCTLWFALVLVAGAFAQLMRWIKR